MKKKDILKEFENYWYYAGEWHDAGCSFICNDQGVCNCNTKKNKQFLSQAIDQVIKQIVESVPMKEIKVDDKNVGKDIPRDTSFWNVNEKICWKDGFNYHTKNVKQWKQEILKQLK